MQKTPSFHKRQKMSTLNQTLQEKFPHLEVSVLKLSEVQRDNETKRIDSEYFKKEYLEKIQALLPQSQKLSKLMVSGYYGILPKSDDYLENGLCLVRGKDLRDSSLEITNLVKVPFNYFDERYCIHKNDILFLVKGATIGNDDGVLFIVDEPQEKMIFNGSVFKLQVKNINPAYIYIFMMTSFFTFQKLREVANNGIEYNSLQTIKNYLIPLLPMPFQLEIEKLVKDSHQALEQSKALYKEAEDLLYTELGLNPQNPLQSILQSHSNNINFRIATLKESFLKTGRLDSEYYQVKYEEIEKRIKSFKSIQLKDLVDYPISSGATPKAGGSDYADSKDGIAFLRAVDLKNMRVELANLIYIKPEIHNKNLKRTKLNKGDVLFSIAGVIGRCAIFDCDFEANINQALSILRFSENKGILRLYLAMFFNSKFGQMYLEKYARQGLQTNLNLEEVGNLEIPILNFAVQEQIASHIQKSFTLRAEAKALLNEAKAKVESAISGGGG